MVSKCYIFEDSLFRCPLIPAANGRRCLDDRIGGVIAVAVAPLAHHHHGRVESAAGATHGIADLLLEDGPHAAAGAVPGGLSYVVEKLEDGDDGGRDPGEQQVEEGAIWNTGSRGLMCNNSLKKCLTERRRLSPALCGLPLGLATFEPLLSQSTHCPVGEIPQDESVHAILQREALPVPQGKLRRRGVGRVFDEAQAAFLAHQAEGGIGVDDQAVGAGGALEQAIQRGRPVVGLRSRMEAVNVPLKGLPEK